MEHDVRSQMTLVTPEIATDILTNRAYPKQRNLARWNVENLAREMACGKFVQGSPIQLVEFAGHENLVNGQHTLNAIIQSKIPTMLTVIQSRVDSSEEVDDIYSSLDTGKSRSAQDAFSAYELDSILGISKTHIGYISSAIKFIEAGFNHPGNLNKMSHRILRVKILEWGDFGKEYLNIVSPAGDNWYRFLRQSVMSVAISTLRYVENHQKAYDFWSQAVLDDGLSKDDPRKALNKLLLTSSVLSGTSSGKAYGPRSLAILTAKAWNAYYAEQPLERIFAHRNPANKPEFKLLGTPWE